MFYFLILAVQSSYAVITLDTFEDDFGQWRNLNRTWERVAISDLIKEDAEFPKSKNLNNQMILVPKVPPGSGLALMTKTLDILAKSVLDIEFSCLVRGWKEGSDLLDRMGNPILQVMYDDTAVFHLETSIMDNLERFSADQWNEFRLHSSYEEKFSMNVTFIGSSGRHERSFLALDNIRVQITGNKDVDSLSQEKPEGIPFIDFEQKNGSWKDLGIDSQEDEEIEMKEKVAPEFCDLFPEKGFCHFFSTRYFFNKSSGTCDKFQYGGCSGNGNNFILKKDCEKLCMNSTEHEDEKVIRDGSTNSSQKTNLTLTFDNGFEDWEEKSWNTIEFDSTKAKELGLEPFNESSQACAAPSVQIQRFQHPKLLHSLNLISDGQILIQFSLKLVGDHNPSSIAFFETFNPGFKIFLGSSLIFNFALDGEKDREWHTYQVIRNTSDFSSFFFFVPNPKLISIVRIEAWQGRWTNTFVALDDLIINQTSSRFEPKRHWIKWTTPIALTTSPKSTSIETTQLETCQQSSERGPCSLHVNRFFFNFKTKTCDRFDYSGCGGNDNNFETEMGCRNRCIDKEADVCQYPMAKGPCSGLIERFYYSAKRKRCSRFMFSGCGSNENNFKTLEDCEAACSSGRERPIRHYPDCFKPINAGECEDEEKMFAYNALENQCVEFTYTGCGGNENMFMFKKDCQALCETNQTEVTQPSDSLKGCQTLSELINLCQTFLDQSERRWFYSSRTGNCILNPTCFKDRDHEPYGHSSKNECDLACVRKSPIQGCLLPHEFGSCNGTFTRFYYEPSLHTCVSFTFSGCLGNENNFMTFDSCLQTCGGVMPNHSIKIKDEDLRHCFLPKVTGSCEEKIPKFYYDMAKDSCQPFNYSGCDGNQNNFESHNQCQALCGGSAMELESSQNLNATQESQTKLNPAAISWIVVLSLLSGILLVIGLTLGVVKYRRAKKSLENYRLFHDENASPSVNTLPDVTYDNPAYSAGSTVAYNSSTNSIHLDTPRESAIDGNPDNFPSSFY